MHRIIFASFVFVSSLALAPAARAEVSPNPKVAATQVALRGLWTGHIFWVRNFVVGTMGKDAAAVKAAEEQVVENARQIAAAIEPFYGKPAADKLFTLLAGHWSAVKAHVEATKNGDDKGQRAAIAQAGKNGDEIATFLGTANPHLPKGTVLSLLVAHVGHHATQNQQIKDRQYGAEAKTWEAMRGHMDVLADAIAAGIAKQFPDRF